MPCHSMIFSVSSSVTFSGRTVGSLGQILGLWCSLWLTGPDRIVGSGSLGLILTRGSLGLISIRKNAGFRDNFAPCKRIIERCCALAQIGVGDGILLCAHRCRENSREVTGLDWEGEGYTGTDGYRGGGHRPQLRNRRVHRYR